MFPYRYPLIAIACLVTLSAILALSNPFTVQGQAQGQAGGPQVTVVNSPEQPVPVEGVIDAFVVGDVTVANLPEVQGVVVENAAPVPVVVRQPDAETRTPFHVNARLTPGGSELRSIPDGKTAVITDIVLQNRAPGDGPVDPSVFSRVDFGTSGLNSQAITSYFTLRPLGNETITLHLQTGVVLDRVSPQNERRINVTNVVNSTAPFFEVLLTGYFIDF